MRVCVCGVAWVRGVAWRAWRGCVCGNAFLKVLTASRALISVGPEGSTGHFRKALISEVEGGVAQKSWG